MVIVNKVVVEAEAKLSIPEQKDRVKRKVKKAVANKNNEFRDTSLNPIFVPPFRA